MSRKTNIIVSILFALLFIVSFFLPVLQFSFHIKLNGLQAFGLNMGRLLIAKNYIEYLRVMMTIISPILVVVLIVWSARKELKMIPLSILSALSLAGCLSWMVKFSGMDILLFGYYYWLIIVVSVIGFNYWKLKKQSQVSKATN